MANLGKKNGIFLARFRFQGREFKKSLKTSERKSAEAAMHRVEDALHRLAIHTLNVPSGVDAGDFIVSGGTLTAPVSQPPVRPVPTLRAALQEYQDNLGHLAASNRYTIGVHLRHVQAKLAGKLSEPIDRIDYPDLEEYIQSRLKERSRTTVSKERETVVQFFAWCSARGYLVNLPTAQLVPIKTSGSRSSKFRTVDEIEAIIIRGGLTRDQEWALWDWLYFAPAEIRDILLTVRERARRDVSYILHALPAYTGMQRSEMLRLQWIDVAFDQGVVTARSRKQSRQEAETQRQIELHPELIAILGEWRHKRPKGQFVISDDNLVLCHTSNDG